MTQSQVVLHKDVNRTEKSMRTKVLNFVMKVQENDELPGLDIKRPQGAHDSNVRTGRIDDNWRAVMFRLASSLRDFNHYVLVGAFPHDEAYAYAERISLQVNPINGVTELIHAAAPKVSAAPTVAHENEPSVAGGEDRPYHAGAEDAAVVTSGAEGAADAATDVGKAAETGSAHLESASTPSESAEGTKTPGRERGGSFQQVGTAHQPAVGERHVGRTLTRIGIDEMVNRLGLRRDLVSHAAGLATVDELLGALDTGLVPEWQADALMDLASGASIDDVALKHGLRAETSDELTDGGVDADHRSADDEAVTSVRGSADQDAVGSTGDADDRAAEAIIRGLHTDAAQLSFALVEGEDELRAAIEGGDFAAWRVFLHPEQRRWAQRDYNGSFRLSGGAGTGKTVVLVHRAVRLQREALAKGKPSPRIVLTTYTKNLADELRAQVRTLAPGAVLADRLGEEGICIAGVDSLAADVLRTASPDEQLAATEAVLGRARTNIQTKTASSAWNDAVLAAGVQLPDRGDGAAFARSEYDLVVLPNTITEKSQYLRVRRPNRGVRLSRGQRADVWEVIEAYRSRANIEDCLDFEETRHLAAEVLRNRSARIDQPGSDDAARAAAYPADHVLVDEGQDLTVGHLKLLRALVRTGRNDIFIAEDSHQRIYGPKIVLSHFGIRIQGRSRRLTLNYRTTEQILRFALTVLAGADVPGEDGAYSDMEGQAESRGGYRSLRTGPQPVLSGCSNHTDEVDLIASIMRGWIEECDSEANLRPEQLAILTRSSRSRDAVVRGLAERGVDVRAVTAGGVAKGKPVVLTMHRAKGTEFRNVILAGVSEDGIPAGLRAERFSEEASADVDQRERSLLYVAATRARDELVVTWTGEASPFIRTT